jgi:transposase IS116/IS110/IS902 family protein
VFQRQPVQKLHGDRFVMLTVPGIAETSALRILGELVVLSDTLDARQWVAFSGLDPSHFSSGTSVEKRHVECATQMTAAASADPRTLFASLHAIRNWTASVSKRRSPVQQYCRRRGFLRSPRQSDPGYQTFSIGQHIEISKVKGIAREQRGWFSEPKFRARDDRDADVVEAVHGLIKKLVPISSPTRKNTTAH